MVAKRSNSEGVGAICRSHCSHRQHTSVFACNLRPIANQLTWQAEADVEGRLSGFIIERDGQILANVPGEGQEPFRPTGFSKPPIQRHILATAH